MSGHGCSAVFEAPLPHSPFKPPHLPQRSPTTRLHESLSQNAKVVFEDVFQRPYTRSMIGHLSGDVRLALFQRST